jgi:hypothetical protein
MGSFFCALLGVKQRSATTMTIREFAMQDGRVYVHLATPELARKFMEQAEAEGFTFQDGTKPTKRKADTVMAINRDLTLNYVGVFGRMAYGSGTATTCGKPLIRVEYAEVVARIEKP